MKRFLAIIRRFFFGLSITLLLCVTLFRVPFAKITESASIHSSIENYISFVLLVSPIAFMLFTIISTIYIRKKGQFAAFHKSQSPIATFFKCIASDITAPFKNIKNFFLAIFSKNVEGRGVLIIRFLEMAFLIFICIVAMGSQLSLVSF